MSDEPVPEMKLCIVNIHTQNMLAVDEDPEHKMYCVQAESLGLILECLDGLVKFKRARLLTIEQLEAMSEINRLTGGS